MLQSEIVGKPSALSITVIVLTANEEIHIERCLVRIRPVAQRMIVVDSYSTDRTVEIAKALGADVAQRAFRHQADQLQWALDALKIDTDWVLRVDADEYFEPAALEEIATRLQALPPEVTGVEFKRKFHFMGRWIRWGGYYPTILTRLWRTGEARIEQRWMDEHAILTRGRATLFAKGDLVDDNLAGIDAWMTKHNRYATRHMIDAITREHAIVPIDDAGGAYMSSRSRLKRFLRNRVFGSAPLYYRSLGYFLYRYVVRLGFLDGRQGLLYHSLQAYCFFLLMDAKIEEARRFIAEHGAGAFRDYLARRYRIALPNPDEGFCARATALEFGRDLPGAREGFNRRIAAS